MLRKERAGGAKRARDLQILLAMGFIFLKHSKSILFNKQGLFSSYVLFLKALSLVGILLGLEISVSAEKIGAPTSAISEKIYTTPKWVSDLYMESYSGMLTPNIIHFQKYELSLTNKYCLYKFPSIDVVPYMAVRNYSTAIRFNFKPPVS